MKMLIFRDAGVLRGKCPVHLGGGIDGVGHRLETRQQAVAKALHQDAAMARQYLGSDDTDEVCPSANGGGFVLRMSRTDSTRSTSSTTVSCRTSATPAPRTSDRSVQRGLLFAFVHRVYRSC